MSVRRCLHGFKNKHLLNNHTPYCKQLPAQRVEMPEKTQIKFDSFAKMVKCPVVIYADFESLIVPKDGELKHEACGFAYKVQSDFPEYNKGVQWFRGPGAVENFLNSLRVEYDSVKQFLEEPPYPDCPTLSPEEQIAHDNATHCYLCKDSLYVNVDPDNYPARDHCHYTEAFLGTAHRFCNLQRSIFKLLPIVFHNLTGYGAGCTFH